MSDWIKHSGNCRPSGIHATDEVAVKLRGGRVLDAEYAGNFRWGVMDSSEDIIAYRLHKPERQESTLTTQLRTATAKRDKQAAKAARHAEKLQHCEAEVERLKSELERHIEAETGLACTIGEKVSGIPDGVDIDDPATWLDGDIILCVESTSGWLNQGREYVFKELDVGGDVKVSVGRGGILFYLWGRGKLRFVRRPA